MSRPAISVGKFDDQHNDVAISEKYHYRDQKHKSLSLTGLRTEIELIVLTPNARNKNLAKQHALRKFIVSFKLLLCPTTQRTNALTKRHINYIFSIFWLIQSPSATKSLMIYLTLATASLGIIGIEFLTVDRDEVRFV